MPTARWTPDAAADFEEIAYYIGVVENRRATARKIASEIFCKFDEYANLFVAGHSLGTARPDLGENFRVFSHKRWVVVFRPIDGGIEVMRILDGARDFPRLFE